MNEPRRETIAIRASTPQDVQASVAAVDAEPAEAVVETKENAVRARVPIAQANSRKKRRREDVDAGPQPASPIPAGPSNESLRGTIAEPEVPVRKPKREQVLCEGTRPSCQSCEKGDLPCNYSADPGLSQAATLKRKYESMRQDYTQSQQMLATFASASQMGDVAASATTAMTLAATTSLQNESAPSAAALLQALATGSDQESSLILARLRLGEKWEDIALSLVDSESSSGLTGDPTSSIYNEPSSLNSAPSLQTSVIQTSSRTWLPKIFDRNYFASVRHIPCSTSNPPIQSPIHATTWQNFGNLPFSSAIAANHSPAIIQQEQQRNLFVPAWAMQSINGAAASADPFENILASLRATILLNSFTQEGYCGSHVYLSALNSQQTYLSAPPLSQIVAQIVHSIKFHDALSTFTQHAIMYWYWTLLRWMLFPSAGTYADIPACARPTPYQLFIAHARSYDFVIIPGLRDRLCKDEWADLRWLTEGGVTLECEWDDLGRGRAVCVDGETGEVDLSPICKVCLPVTCGLVAWEERMDQSEC